jgi:hypothetical protein
MSIELLRSIHRSEENFMCFECGYKNSSWACTELCIFLCVDCAHMLKEQAAEVAIKSLTMAEWTREDVAKLRNGGNLRLRSLLIQYGITKNTSARSKYASKAVEYYRNLLKAETYHYRPPEPPALEEGASPAGEQEKNWWNKAKDSVKVFAAFGDNPIVQGLRNNDAITYIRDRGVNAICGLRELTYARMQNAFTGHRESFQPDYMKMEEPLNRG